MTVTTTASNITYLGDGATTVFTFNFPGVAPEDIHLYIIDSSGNIAEVPPNVFSVTLETTIDPNPTAVGGVVIYPLVGSPLAVGDQLLIARVLDVLQLTSISNQGILYPQVIEQSLDYLTMLIQGGAVSIDISRTFQVAQSDPIPALVPSVALRANQPAFFDSLGNLTGGGTAGSVFISSVMIPVVGAADLPSAQEAMGIPELIAAAVGSSGYSTGDLKPSHKVVADAGWILWTDGNIGDASSGATIRANADTQELFILYYNSYSDASCPVSTSVGAATTRAAQGTAVAAYAAHCRMSLPLGAGRALAIAGLGVGLAGHDTGQATGTETVTPSIDTMAAHSHDPPDPFAAGSYLGTGVAGFNNITFSGTGSVFNANTPVVGGGMPLNTIQPTTYISVMVKL
jgi:hypothetical protein